MCSSKERPPMMLKEYLREDQSFDAKRGLTSTHRGCCQATLRRLLDMELREGAGDRGKPACLTRSRSKGVALTRISSLLNVVRMLATATASASASPRNPKQGILQGSLSKRLLPRTFWRRRCSQRKDLRGQLRSPVGMSGGIGEGRFLIRDVIQLESFVAEARGDKADFSPWPLDSCSTSGCSEVDSSSGSNTVGSSSSPVTEFAKPNSPPAPEKKRPDTLADCPSRSTGDAKIEAIKERESGERATCHDYQEKEQLSPVSVMDFPYDEEEEETASEAAAASPSFHQSLASIERTTQELLEKIRRFESLASLVDPVDLDEAFSEEEEMDGQDDEPEDDAGARARWLLEQVNGWSATERGSNRILLDFFVEGLREGDRTADEGLLFAAREWTAGIARKDVASREALTKEMDMDGRWRCANVVDDGIAAELEGEVLATLVDELVLGMVLD